MYKYIVFFIFLFQNSSIFSSLKADLLLSTILSKISLWWEKIEQRDSYDFVLNK